MEQGKFDIVLFGATGFTGKLCAQYLAEAGGRRKLRWALAGRSRDKLAAVRDALTEASQAPELLVADVADEASIRRMVEQARVLITTVGPYGRYGEPVVKACAELGVDYVDLTGEPAFVRAMAARYHETAKAQRAKIVHASGFDSVPHDLGAYFTLQRLREQMSEAERESAKISIEGVLRMRGSFSGGTWHSMLDILSQHFPEQRARKQAAAARQAEPRKATVTAKMGFRPELKLWALPMPTIDPEVVVRSAELLPEYGPDFSYGHYMGLRRATQAAGVVLGVGMLFTLAQLPPARALLRKVKDPGEGPSAETRAKSYFRVLFRGQAAGHTVACEVRGGDPGYGETAKMLAESALCLAFDRARLSQHYGVVTPAAAMGNPLIERLQTAGITFTQTSNL